MTGHSYDSRLATVFTIEAIVVLATFVIASLLHIGVRLPIGIDEPRIIPATIVEGLIALSFLVAVFSLLASSPAAWTSLVAAHCVGIAGVLLGIGALAAGRGPSTEANHIYHRVVLAVLIVGLIALLTPAGKTAFNRRAPQFQAAKHS
jgi:hypothetical protein